MPEPKQSPASAAPAAATPEPLAAVLAEMREAGRSDEHADGPLIEDYADRIEAAAERERVKARRDAEIEWTRIGYDERKAEEKRAPGNAAAMRDLLEKIRHEYGWGRIGSRTCVSSEADVERVSDLFEKQIDAALAAPARNCDVGTAEEQAERHERFCAAHYKADAVDAQCFGCPACNKKETDCEFIWGQLPFARAEGGDHA